jgi:hypothetical protein
MYIDHGWKEYCFLYVSISNILLRGENFNEFENCFFIYPEKDI